MKRSYWLAATSVAAIGATCLIGSPAVAQGVSAAQDSTPAPAEAEDSTSVSEVVTYAQGPASLTAQVRMIGKAKLNNAWGPRDLDDNSVPAIGYLDLRGQWDLRESVQIFAAIDNVTNVDPPTVAASPATGQQAYYFTAVRGDIYDTLGRAYRAGVRLRF